MSKPCDAQRNLRLKLIPAAVGLAFAGAAVQAAEGPAAVVDEQDRVHFEPDRRRADRDQKRERRRRHDDAAVELDKVHVEGRAEGSYGADLATSPKFTAPIADTPKSITVIPESLMRDTAATSLQDALRTVPGVTLLAGEGGQALADRPVLRGINSSASMFVDGVRDIGTQTRDIFDLEAVEVFKGADSAYSGRGGGGGSINLVSKTAVGEEFTRATLMGGTDDLLRATVDQNWAIGDSMGARLTGMGTKSGTPGRDGAVDYDKWGFSPSIAFGIGKATRVTLDYYLYRESGMPDYSIPYDLSSGLPVTETLNIDSENFYGLDTRDFRDGETDIGTIEVAHDLNADHTIRNVTRYGTSLNSYVVTNPDDSAGNVANGYVYRSTKQRWAETETFANVTDLTGRFETGSVQHRYNAGVEYSREKKTQDGWSVSSDASAFGRDCSSTTLDPVTGMTYGELLIANGDCTSLADPDPYDAWGGTVMRNHTPTVYTTDATAVYAFDTLTLSPSWQLNIGLRWDNYETDTDSPTNPPAHQEDDFINYQAGLVYKPVEDGSIYASYATTSTPAALGNGDEDGASSVDGRGGPANQNLEPEESATAEVGAKWQLFGDRLLLTAAYFETVRENANIEVDAGLYRQVGETEVKGFEVSFSGAITPRWQVFGGYSYLDSELTRSGYNDPAEGQPLPNTPENSFTLFTTYAVMPAVQIGGGAFYVDEVYGRTAPLESRGIPVLKVPDYWRYDAMASWKVNEKVSLQFNVNNLTDEVYYTKAYAAHYAALGSGRQYVISGNLSF